MAREWNPEAEAQITAFGCRMTLLADAMVQVGAAFAHAGIEIAKFRAAAAHMEGEIEREARERAAKKDGENE